MRTCIGMVLAVLVTLAGVARADEIRTGSLGTGIDIYTAQCKSPKTHCLFAYICGSEAGGSGFLWEMTMTVVSPTLFYGVGDVSNSLGTYCNTGGVLLCRPGTTVGAMKALITVTKTHAPPPLTALDPYELNFGCFDKNMEVLPDASDSLTRTTHTLNQ